MVHFEGLDLHVRIIRHLIKWVIVADVLYRLFINRLHITNGILDCVIATKLCLHFVPVFFSVIRHLVGWVIVTARWLLLDNLIYIVNGILKGEAFDGLGSLVGFTRRGFKPPDSLDTIVYGVEYNSLGKNWAKRLVPTIKF